MQFHEIFVAKYVKLLKSTVREIAQHFVLTHCVQAEIIQLESFLNPKE